MNFAPCHAWIPHGDYFFWDGGVRPKKDIAATRRELQRAFKAANVAMTQHQFRHFFISTALANVEDVSEMVGTSPDEIRQTYKHKIKAQTDRLDKAQEQMWLARGLDSHGNPQVAA